MSTNHNRIKVADLEKNQPDKILVTNQNGELEFSDVNNLQAESYNALDCTTEGKSLDARQGKALKDMIDLKEVDLASDTETQITTAVSEDKKVVSRLKLLNWWNWIKAQSQTISGSWTFTKPIVAPEATSDNELATLNQVNNFATLQAILDKNPNAQQDNNQSFATLLGGSENNRITQLCIGNTVNQANMVLVPYSAILAGIDFENKKAGIICVESGRIELKQIDTEKGFGTDIIVENPISNSQYVFKAKEEGKKYFVATTEDIPDETPSATTTVKGSVKLAGDLGGTADLPTVPGLSYKLTAALATDAETQITVAVPEDNKVVSRSKLYNWWEWIISQAQTITGDWNFIKGLKVQRSSGAYTYTSQLLENVLSIQVNSIYGLVRSQYEIGLIRWISDGFITEFKSSTPTQHNTITLPNKSGTVALTNDFITTAGGTTTTPAIIVPNGVLTTVPQNGALERDSNGILWETHNNIRKELVPTRFSKNVDPGAGTNYFIKYNSNIGDIIPASTVAGSGKIYPSGLNSTTGMSSGDIIESSFVIFRSGAPATADYIFRIEFWNTTTSGGTPTIQSIYNYAWNTVAFPAISIKIIFTKRTNLTQYGYLISYVVLINGVYVYTTANFYSWDKADCRMLLVNNNAGTNNVIFNQAQAVNFFVPISQSL
jgi:hypothetical protein